MDAKGRLQSAPLAAYAAAVVLSLASGCKPVVQVGSTSRPVIEAQADVDVASPATSQSSTAGDQYQSGGGVQVGGGNSVKLDGATLVTIGGIVAGVYLASKGMLKVGGKAIDRHRNGNAHKK